MARAGAFDVLSLTLFLPRDRTPLTRRMPAPPLAWLPWPRPRPRRPQGRLPCLRRCVSWRWTRACGAPCSKGRPALRDLIFLFSFSPSLACPCCVRFCVGQATSRPRGRPSTRPGLSASSDASDDDASSRASSTGGRRKRGPETEGAACSAKVRTPPCVGCARCGWRAWWLTPPCCQAGPCGTYIKRTNRVKKTVILDWTVSHVGM